MNAPRRQAWTAAVMGTTVSIHVIAAGAVPPRAADAAASTIAALRELDALFSPFRSASQVSRLRRGELALADADPRLRGVAQACATLETATGGRFSASWRGGFDPTGYVKGWAADRSADAHLVPLLEGGDVVAVGINVGGDLRVWTAADADWSWRIGIADPRLPGALLATVELRAGAVATSGTAERGAHLIDPRSGKPVPGLVSATVVADDLTTADAWATAVAVSADDDLGWLWGAPLRSGLVAAATDGPGGEPASLRVRRWLGGVGVETVIHAAA